MPNSKQRREAERRRLQRQLERRAQREARRRRALVILSVVGVLAVVAAIVLVVALSGSDDKKSPSAAGGSSTTPAAGSSTASSSAAVPAYPCTWTKAGTAARTAKVPSTTTPPRTGKATLSVRTSQGAMTFTLDRAKAPCAVASFVSLAQQKYFDGTPCHRLTGGSLSVLQCGDPTGSGSGGPGYQFHDELTGSEKYTRGVLAMANAGANTNGSQFFIVYKDSQLGPNYTVFGSVTKGLDVVDKVAAKGSTPAHDGKPKLAISLQKVTVAK